MGRDLVAKCPKCKVINSDAEKTWKYQQFNVGAYTCLKCGTRFRDYSTDGKHNFTLILEEGKGFQKVP